MKMPCNACISLSVKKTDLQHSLVFKVLHDAVCRNERTHKNDASKLQASRRVCYVGIILPRCVHVKGFWDLIFWERVEQSDERDSKDWNKGNGEAFAIGEHRFGIGNANTCASGGLRPLPPNQARSDELYPEPA